MSPLKRYCELCQQPRRTSDFFRRIVEVLSSRGIWTTMYPAIESGSGHSCSAVCRCRGSWRGKVGLTQIRQLEAGPTLRAQVLTSCKRQLDSLPLLILGLLNGLLWLFSHEATPLWFRALDRVKIKRGLQYSPSTLMTVGSSNPFSECQARLRALPRRPSILLAGHFPNFSVGSVCLGLESPIMLFKQRDKEHGSKLLHVYYRQGRRQL